MRKRIGTRWRGHDEWYMSLCYCGPSYVIDVEDISEMFHDALVVDV